MSTHRREVRPRYGRIAALSAAMTVSLVAALAGLGVLAPSSADVGHAADPTAGPRSSVTDSAAASPSTTSPVTAPATPATTLPTTSATTPTTGATTMATTGEESSGAAVPTIVALPPNSGTGRRIVFSQSQQRVWLVDADNRPERTYLVSGSTSDNLQPGTYDVTSRQRHAVGIDYSGVMQYFVVFTAGPTGASIGFHTIPTSHGVPLQSVAQLGTPESHGCIRQKTSDAIALWHFAPLGTKVVVVA